VELARNFLPVADEVYRLQTGSDPECRHFQKIAEQGHYAGQTRPSSTRQGTYAAAPSGLLLGSLNSNDPERVAEMMRRALARWETLTPEERLLPPDRLAGGDPIRRLEHYFPDGGLVLVAHTRDLPRDTRVEGWRAAAANQDHAWFTRTEARRMVPEQPRTGLRQEVPVDLVRRLVRLHLVDNVRGQTRPYADHHVRRARLVTEVTAIEGSVVRLKLEGETLAQAEGRWPVAGYRDAERPSPQTRGFETRLLGEARFDLEQERFVSFELLALGQRWGGTQYNGRADDLHPAPVGVFFTLAPNTPAGRVAPAFFGDYGWRSAPSGPR
jgi:hypothetical protein